MSQETEIISNHIFFKNIFMNAFQFSPSHKTFADIIKIVSSRHQLQEFLPYKFAAWSWGINFGFLFSCTSPLNSAEIKKFKFSYTSKYLNHGNFRSSYPIIIHKLSCLFKLKLCYKKINIPPTCKHLNIANFLFPVIKVKIFIPFDTISLNEPEIILWSLTCW